MDAKGIIDEVVSLHESHNDLSSLVIKILGDKTDAMSSLISYKHEYVKQLFDAYIAQDNYFSALALAKAHDITHAALDVDFSSPNVQENYAKGFFKHLFASFSTGDVSERAVLDYLDFLAEQDIEPDFASFDPLSSKYSTMHARLGDTLLDVASHKKYGVVGKCVAYFDNALQSFIVEGNVHPQYCVRSDMAEFTFPDWTYEHGGGFGYHKSLLPRGSIEFGGARYFFHQKGFVFFHHSGDFGKMSPYIAQHAVASSQAKLHPDAFTFLDGAENYASWSKQDKKHFFGRTFLQKISSEAVSRIKRWGASSQESADLFTSVPSSSDDDLPF